MRTLLFFLLMTGVAVPVQGQQAPSPVTDAPDVSLSEVPSSRTELDALPDWAPADAALVHVVGTQARLYNRSDSTAPVQQLPVRTPLHRLDCSDGWCRVRTEEGRTGYIRNAAVSNVWIRVSKEDRRAYLYRGPVLEKVIRADIGYNTFSDKKRQGSLTRRDHWRTPEGVLYVVHKNPSSDFHKALVLNYPTIDDAERGLDRGLISRSEYDAIVQAQRDFRMPPMDTDLGGWIEIHGEGTNASTTWTRGCVALPNEDLDQLWPAVPVGTPVLIE